MTRAENMKLNYHRRRQNGLCGRCGKQPPEGDKAACRACLDYEAEKKAVSLAKKMAPIPLTAGCVLCHQNEPMTGHAICWCCMDYGRKDDQ